jgi:aspartyl-tRNA(Asn)/glutamyl-tRNA(Gln) amidotransferase subunit A
VVPLARSHDSVGLLARSVPDVVSLFAALTGADAGEARFNLDPPHAGNDAPEPTLAVLLLPEGLSPSPAVAQALAHAQDAARAAGFALEPLRLDGFDPGPALKALLLVVEAEAWVVHQPQLLAAPETFSKSFRAALEWGGNQPAGRLAAAWELLRALRRSVRAQLKPFAGLLLPTLPQTAPAADEPLPKSLAALTVIGSIAGLSGISLPMGAAASASGAFPGDAGLDSLPRAVQILAGTDECVLSLALRLSRSLPAVPQPAGFLD